MASNLIKKQEEKDLQKIRELLRLSENKRCFDCSATSPFFVDMTVLTFVCARCSGLVREVGHRVKSISTSKFSGPETTSLEMGGNAMAKRIWLHGYRSELQYIESDYDVRLFMRQKYYEHRWLDRALAKEHSEKIKRSIMELYTEDGLPRHGFSSRRLSVKTATSPTSPHFTLPPPPTSPNSVKQHNSLLTDSDRSFGLTVAANEFSSSQHTSGFENKREEDTRLPLLPTSTTQLPSTHTSMDTFDFSWSDKVTTAATPTNLHNHLTNAPMASREIHGLAPPPPPSSSILTPTSTNSTSKSPTSPTPQPIDPFAALRGLSF